MRFGLLFLICGVITLTEAASHRYNTIVERNVFGLKQPEPLPPTIRHEPVEKLKLTGLASIAARKQALLMRANPGKAPKYFNLDEGESEGGLEVLAIDLQAETVHLRQEGSDLVLSFARPGMGGDFVAEISSPRALQSVHAGLAPIPP
jgi:hypothetical protein